MVCPLGQHLVPGHLRHLAAQDAFEGGDYHANGDMRQKAVMNPVAGEADYQVDILHRPNSVPRQQALGPIGQDGGSK